MKGAFLNPTHRPGRRAAFHYDTGPPRLQNKCPRKRDLVLGTILVIKLNILGFFVCKAEHPRVRDPKFLVADAFSRQQDPKPHVHGSPHDPKPHVHGSQNDPKPHTCKDPKRILPFFLSRPWNPRNISICWKVLRNCPGCIFENT